ncbi:hypothetical protein [Anaeromyxobacter sp. PSR-1]|uniref:hypothetical protein n=1 Tax=Anaeromyxobacter sp. PSR-1 TaxID=1300915 RepID=UPI0005E2741F|nr:hypothetical protein [Anaeromyxobacter sp. PSR-1]GAO01918.1 hypothetical protein PSR1_00781 [Anaeromyxobacter sp. PSR-1]
MEYIADIKEHLTLLVGAGLGIYWIVKRVTEAIRAAKGFVNHAVDERMPQIIKSTLSNGGGEIIRKIVREENTTANREIIESLATEANKVREHGLRINDLEDRVDALEKGSSK